MVKVYVNLIKAGRRTLDDVPEQLREAVRAALEELEAAEEKPEFDFTGMSAAEVWRSLSYRPTKDELQQACDWLGIEYEPNATNSALKALLREAYEAEAGE